MACFYGLCGIYGEFDYEESGQQYGKGGPQMFAPIYPNILHKFVTLVAKHQIIYKKINMKPPQKLIEVETGLLLCCVFSPPPTARHVLLQRRVDRCVGVN